MKNSCDSVGQDRLLAALREERDRISWLVDTLEQEDLEQKQVSLALDRIRIGLEEVIRQRSPMGAPILGFMNFII